MELFSYTGDKITICTSWGKNMLLPFFFLPLLTSQRINKQKILEVCTNVTDINMSVRESQCAQYKEIET